MSTSTFIPSSDKKVSLTAFRVTLGRMNFKSRVATKKPALKQRHKEPRLACVKERLNWTKDDWNKVVWSDEAKFTLKSASARTRVIRKDGERYEERHIKGTHKFGLGSVMVWGCFHANVGPLVVQRESIDQKVYVQCLVDSYLLWIEKESEKTNIDHILQGDNAPCHIGHHKVHTPTRLKMSGYAVSQLFAGAILIEQSYAILLNSVEPYGRLKSTDAHYERRLSQRVLQFKDANLNAAKQLE
ncbi:Transposable element Tc1 transposase, partial [Choanephora cucurbitarum]